MAYNIANRLPERASELAALDIGEATRWGRWQRAVLRTLRVELREVLPERLTLDDVDWYAWQYLYLRGHNPRSAVRRGLELDFWRTIQRR